jgi:hypothetical protein
MVDCYLLTSRDTTLFNRRDTLTQYTQSRVLVTIMRTIPNVIPLDVHQALDKESGYLQLLPFDTLAPRILSNIINESIPAYSNTEWPINATVVDTCEKLLASNKEIRDILENAHHSGQYSQIRDRGMWPTQFTLFLY